MFVLRIASCPHSKGKEVVKKWKEVRAASKLPNYMNLVGSWTIFIEDKLQTIQVFQVEGSKERSALEHMDTLLVKEYGDIPGLSFTHKVAYTPDEVIKMFGMD
jgi:hypothetical protein